MGGRSTKKPAKKPEWTGYPIYPEDVATIFPEDELGALRYLFFYEHHRDPWASIEDTDYLINLLAAINSIYKKFQSTTINPIYNTYSWTVRHAIEYKTRTLTNETIHNLAKPKLEQNSAEELQHLYAMAALFFKIALKHEPEANEILNKSINRYLTYYCDLNNAIFDTKKTDELLIEACQKLQIYLSPKKISERIDACKNHAGYKNFEQQAKYKRTAANLALAYVTKELNILQNPQTILDEGDIHFASEPSDTTSNDDSLSGDEKNRATPEKDKTTPYSYTQIIRALPMCAITKLRSLFPSPQESNYKPLLTEANAHKQNKCVTITQSEMPPPPRCAS